MMGGLPSGPGGSETFRESSGWGFFLVLIRGRKIGTVGEEVGDLGKRGKVVLEANQGAKTSVSSSGSQARSPKELRMGGKV